jgi:hypothetical protein
MYCLIILVNESGQVWFYKVGGLLQEKRAKTGHRHYQATIHTLLNYRVSHSEFHALVGRSYDIRASACIPSLFKI